MRLFVRIYPAQTLAHRYTSSIVNRLQTDLSGGWELTAPHRTEGGTSVRPARPWFSGNAIALVAMLSVGTLAACSSSGPSGNTASPGNSKAPITIGASLSETGDFSADGQAFEKGYKLWVKD